MNQYIYNNKQQIMSSEAVHNNQQLILQPPLYFAEQHIWNLCFHPSADIIACSEITGLIQILAYNSDDVKPLIQQKDIHKSSARYCTFNPSGNCLVLASCGEDKRIGFLDANGKIAHILKKAHSEPINRCKFLSDQLIISGDDDGIIKIWDLRTVDTVFQFGGLKNGQGEAISGFVAEADYIIYDSCINGTIAGYDLRKTSDSMTKLMACSDSLDEELTGIQLMKNGNYLVCPSSQGVVNIFKKQHIEQVVDRMQGQPGSIQGLIKTDQNTILTGCEDGFVRGVSIYPNKVLQILGQHEQQQNFPIQSLSLSHCKKFLASSSHDNSIKFYDVTQFLKKRSQNTAIMSMQEFLVKKQQVVNQNYDSYEDDDSDSDDSDENQMEEQEPNRQKKKKNKKLSIKAREKQIKKQNIKGFFKGL